MSVYRTYINKQATLIKDNYTNNSKNPVFEIVRGKDIYSRYIFEIDFSDLRTKIETNTIPSGTVQTHKLHFTSAIEYREDLIGKKYINGGFYRDYNYELQLFKVDEQLEEGIFYDYIYLSGINSTITSSTQQIPNWVYRTSTQTWNQPGTFTGTTTAVTDTQYFTNGNEAIEFDITAEVNDLIYNQTGNTLTFGIGYSPSYETGITGDNKYVTSFFSKYTQSYFEPYIQTNYNNWINDDRNKFYLNKTNYLYLYPNSNLDSVDKVEIYDYTDTLVETITGSSISRIDKFTYKIPFSASSETYPDMVLFTDKWYFTKNGKSFTVDNEFLLQTENYFDDEAFSFENSQFAYSIIGLPDKSTISRSEGTRRIQIATKRMYNSSIEGDTPLETLEYRIYLKQGQFQIEVIPFTSINMTPNKNYFDLDVSWLIPQTYFIEIRAKKNGVINTNGNKTIEFKVVSER